jgi:thiol:disulfide interchange protein
MTEAFMQKIIFYLFFFFIHSLCSDVVDVQLFSSSFEKEVWVGVKVDVTEKGWHVYWKNPGELDFPEGITLNWHTSEQLRLGKVRYSVPEIIPFEGLITFGSEKELWIFQQFISEQEIFDEEINVDLSWIACKTECIMGNVHKSIRVLSKQTDPVFQHAFSQLPEKKGLADHIERKDNGFCLNSSLFKREGGRKIYFYPYASGTLFTRECVPLGQVRCNKGQTIPYEPGILALYSNENELLASWEVDPSKKGGETALLPLLFFAFIGGIILNLMPCIFPVLSIKVMSLIKVSEEKRGAFFYGLMTTFGVLLTFWTLALLLILAKYGGESLGWGFQFQNATFVALLGCLLFLFSLSFLGVFELNLGIVGLGDSQQKKPTPLGSIYTGILTAILSTPCTGPFLGPVLGVSLSLHPVHTFLIFTFLALGLCFPLLLLTLFPQALFFLPKPGEWMIRFKQVMGFLMMAAVIWLTWVYVGLKGDTSLLIILFAYLILASVFWIYGLVQNRLSGSWQKRGARALLLCSFIFIFYLFHIDRAPDFFLEEEVFSMNKVEELIKEEKPIFVNFTAKWCLICQVNKLALADEEVQNLFKKKGVRYLVADWTKRDNTIAQALAQFGRNSVPLYLLYLPGKKEPKVLPQVLTPDILTDYLNQIEEKQ